MEIENKEDLVSIIMPSYNTGKFIKETIMSVINQTYKNWELIIVDDCSNDNTDKVVTEFLSDERIRYYKNEINIGAALSRNKAIQMAKGKFIAFLDSDDIWNDVKLEKQLQFMKENSYHFSYTAYEEIDEKSRTTGVIINGPKKITKIGMYRYCWPGCLTVIYDAEYIGNVQVANLKKNNDYAMWLKVIEKSNCYLLNENLAKYRKRQGSISSEKKIKLIKYHYQLFRIGLEKNVIFSIALTINNLLFGIIKKIKYKKIKR